MVPLLLSLLLQAGASEEERAQKTLEEFKVNATKEFITTADPVSHYAISTTDRILVPAMVVMLQDARPLVRRSALKKLGELYDRSSVPRIVALLEDKEEMVRITAMNVLGSLNAIDAVPSLLAHAKAGSVNERLWAVRALGWMEAKDAVPTLLKLCDDKEDNLRRAAADALAQLRDPVAEPTLIRLAKSPDGPSGALEGLLYLRSAKLLPMLPALAKDSRQYSRIIAARTFAAMGSAQHRSQVLTLLKDTDPIVQKGAIRAVAALGLKEAVNDVVRLLGSTEPGTREAALEALAFLDAQDRLEAVTPLLSDADVSVRYAAIRAVARLGGPKAIEPLQALLKSSTETQYAVVSAALIRSGDRGVIPEMMKRMQDRYLSDEGSVFYSLNMLRRRELWDRLQKARVKKLPRGTVMEVFDQLAKEAGLKFEAPEILLTGDRELVCRHSNSLSRDQTFPLEKRPLADLIGEIAREDAMGWSTILEADSLRLVRYEVAVKFWQDWWKAEQDKKGPR